MTREDLLNAIDDFKNSTDISHSIDLLKDLANDYCDNYEIEFNAIREYLEPLAPHIEKVQDAYNIAEKCSINLN